MDTKQMNRKILKIKQVERNIIAIVTCMVIMRENLDQVLDHTIRHLWIEDMFVFPKEMTDMLPQNESGG